MKKILLLLFLIPNLVMAETIEFYAGHYYGAITIANKFKNSECPPPKNNTIPSLKSAEREILSSISSSKKNDFLKFKNSAYFKNKMKKIWNSVEKGMYEMHSSGIDCIEIQGLFLWPPFHSSTIEWEKAKLQNK